MTRVQALQLLGLKVGASEVQITESYHKLHPGAERAAADGHPERMRRLDEAYQLLMAETGALSASEESEDDKKSSADAVDAAARKREQARINMNKSSGMIWWVLGLIAIGAVVAWKMGYIKLPGS